jgi:hydrogenase-4 component B
VQHNLKKLLAYHSIENIGIIGMGIGIGCIGLGTGNQILASLGFAGALLHTLNHALFKSLLFYTAGNVYQATHTLHIEHLGGIMKKMPQTAILFLIAAIAICGIPPFNGFISEFLIYIGLYNWLQHATLVSLVFIVFSIVGLVLIGGLALICFTKAFGIVFLGNPRKEFTLEVKEVHFTQLAPLYLIALLIVLIGSFPQLFLNYLTRPVGLFTGVPELAAPPLFENISAIMQPVAWSAWGVILLTLVLWGIRKMVKGFAQRREERKGNNNGIKSPISNIEYPISNIHSQIRNQKSQIRNQCRLVKETF